MVYGITGNDEMRIDVPDKGFVFDNRIADDAIPIRKIHIHGTIKGGTGTEHIGLAIGRQCIQMGCQSFPRGSSQLRTIEFTTCTRRELAPTPRLGRIAMTINIQQLTGRLCDAPWPLLKGPVPNEYDIETCQRRPQALR